MRITRSVMPSLVLMDSLLVSGGYPGARRALCARSTSVLVLFGLRLPGGRGRLVGVAVAVLAVVLRHPLVALRHALVALGVLLVGVLLVPVLRAGGVPAFGLVVGQDCAGRDAGGRDGGDGDEC